MTQNRPDPARSKKILGQDPHEEAIEALRRAREHKTKWFVGRVLLLLLRCNKRPSWISTTQKELRTLAVAEVLETAREWKRRTDRYIEEGGCYTMEFAHAGFHARCLKETRQPAKGALEKALKRHEKGNRSTCARATRDALHELDRSFFDRTKAHHTWIAHTLNELESCRTHRT